MFIKFIKNLGRINFAFIRNRKFLLIIASVLCFFGGFGWEYWRNSSAQTGNFADSTPAEQIAAGVDVNSIPTPPPDLDENLASSSATVTADSKHVGILFLGYGGAGHSGGYLSDTIILAYLDVVKKKLALIHIPRDIWVDVKVGSTSMPMKINGALAMGTKTSNYPTTTVSEDTVLRASTLTKQAVTTITGLPIDFVVGVDFNSFPAAIDSLGGIEVNVPTVFDDHWYPVKGRELELCGHTPEAVTAMSATMSGFTLEKQFPCRYEHLHFDAGKNHMNGETALKYARSRHSSSDFDRGRRQIAIILATVDKLFSLNALDNIPKFYTSLTKSIKTDISAKQISLIKPILSTFPDLEVVEVGLDTTNVLQEGKASSGAFILISKDGMHNWQGTQGYVRGRI